MSNKKVNTLLSMLAFGIIAENNSMGSDRDSEYSKELFKQQAERSRKDKMKSQGINEYYYGENIITARTQKMADKKAKKKGYL